MDSLVVLVPFYNAERELESGFLDDLLATAAEVTRAEVSVVAIDDASADDTVARLEPYRRTDGVSVYAHGTNTDYDGAMNDLIRIGGERHDPDGYLFFSQDASVEAADIDVLLRCLSADPDLGIVQPLVRDTGGGIYSFGHRYNRYYMCHPIVRGRPVRRPWADPDWLQRPSVSLLGTVVRSQVFDDIGILDERYEHYWESSDICFRARRAGWDVGVATGATAIHDRDLSNLTPDELYHVYRNWPLFWAKYDRTVADRILTDFWPESAAAVGDVTENDPEVDDLDFLRRARADATDALDAFSAKTAFTADELDPDRYRRIGD